MSQAMLTPCETCDNHAPYNVWVVQKQTLLRVNMDLCGECRATVSQSPDYEVILA